MTLKKLSEQATPGEWGLFDDRGTLEIGHAEKPGERPCIIGWPGFDSTDKPMAERRANAKFIVALVNAYRAGEVVAASPEVGAPVTQCFTAGAVSSTTEGTRLVCAKCGQQHLMAMGLFDYDLNQHADYPTEHPDRCLKLDGKYYDPPIMEQGKSRPHWRCHKKAGHDSTNGGMHCSTHRDCGVRIGDPGDRGICGNEPLHDNGIHEAHSSPRAA